MQHSKERTQRQLRVGHEIRRILSEAVIRDAFLDDANAHISVTITEVKISPDLKHATAFVMPLGGANLDEIIEVLQKEIPNFRTLIAKQLRTKYVPNLQFKIDDSFEQAERISKLLNQPRVKRDIDHKEDDEEQS